jgi:hypothetical protein
MTENKICDRAARAQLSRLKCTFQSRRRALFIFAARAEKQGNNIFSHSSGSASEASFMNQKFRRYNFFMNQLARYLLLLSRSSPMFSFFNERRVSPRDISQPIPTVRVSLLFRLIDEERRKKSTPTCSEARARKS